MTSNMDDFIEKLKIDFSFLKKDASEMIKRFQKEMELGLKGEKSSLKMLPSFVKRPKGNEKGTFLAIDIGGTNLRVLAVRLSGGGKIDLIGIKRFALEKEIISNTANIFFDFIADSVSIFLKEYKLEPKYKVGFTFSFPVVQKNISSGVLISWTKGFSAEGVEGEDVVFLLNQAFKRRNLESLKLVALVNDTVGTLVTEGYRDNKCDVGVILGTGTNAAYPERIEHITKYREKWDSDEMIINIEWGGFDKIKRNLYDETLDRNSENIGEQRMEKMISGRYLGEIVRIIILDAFHKGLLDCDKIPEIFLRPYSLTTEQLSWIVADNQDFLFRGLGIDSFTDRDIKMFKEVARIVSERAARIAACAIGAVLTHMDKGIKSEHKIAIDGSLFEGFKGFRENMEVMLEEIFGGSVGKIRLTLIRDGSGIGAAIVAAIETFVH